MQGAEAPTGAAPEWEMRSDADLIRAARTDAGAFRELYDRYAEQVHGYHLRRTRDPHAAHDLTAETFAQAWLARRRFRDRAGGSAGPWLFGIARNLLSQSVRRRRIELKACARIGLLERLDEPRATAEPDDVWLDEAMAELPSSERAALELRVIDGLPYDAVAAGLSTSEGAARVRVARGLGRLRQRLIGDEREAV
ncbi:MAG TPA: sigma-70 family RNA polymerase sigma factor [Gaiellaceae bacterium]|nr:sigma-70 family RNA polymerase sigma factor [Gaiellaceae bacterium]